MAHVVIIGGGPGGLTAAHQLRSLYPDLEVTLVAREDKVFMGFAQFWDLRRARPLSEGTRSLGLLEKRGIRFVHDEVIEIDPSKPSVTTASNGSIEADGLVVALGSINPPAHDAIIAEPCVLDLYSPGALPDLHEALDQMQGGRIMVSILGMPHKCPPAPLEAGPLICDRLTRDGKRDRFEVTVTTPLPLTLPVVGTDSSAWIATKLSDFGIRLLTESAVQAVQTVEDGATRYGTVTFASGATEDFDLMLAVPGCAPPPVVATSGLAAASGWIEPDPTTLRTAFPRVYAVGDCTHVPNAVGALPKAGVFAAGEAVTATANLAVDLGLSSETSEFDGMGSCFMELPDRQVAIVEGNFFASPVPAVTLSEPSVANWERKMAFESQYLDLWFG